MFLNYLKLASRLLFRNPFLTFIHVAGLSVGLATFMMLWPLAEFELKSDRYHADSERILRVGVDFKWTDDGQNWNGFLGAFNWMGVTHELQQTFPKVETTSWIVPQNDFRANVHGLDQNIFVTVFPGSDKKTSFRETQSVIASSSLFQFFTIPLIEGDAGSVLANPNSVVLSQSVSRKYFGEGEWMGQTIYLNDTIPLLVTGIFKDLPHNTHLKFNIVLSAAGNKNVNVKEFDGWIGYCYLKMKAGETIESFNQELESQQQSIYNFTKLSCAHCDITARPQRLTDVVFTNWRGNDFNYKSKFLLEALAVVAFVVLGFAWINYINLSVNSLNKRLSEIGTRKSVGAKGNDFFFQFLVESLVMNMISFGIALTLVQLMGKMAEDWFGFYIPSWTEISLKNTIIILFTLGVGVVVATLCPLILITRRKPNELFKKFKSHIRSGTANTVLVTLQYSIATVLLVWIGAVYFQLNFLLHKDIGIQKEGIVVVEGPLQLSDENQNKMPSFLNEVRVIPGIVQATVSNSTVGDPDSGGGLNVQLPGSSIWFGVDTNGGVDESFLGTYSIELLAGRNFLADNPADRKNTLISKALTKRLGFATLEEALGKKILISKGDVSGEAEIIGVFKDYEFRPFFSDLTEKDRGVILTYKNFLVSFFKPLKFSLQVDMQKLNAIMPMVEQLYKDTYQESIKWGFLDEKIRMQYADEQATKNQLAFFSILAIGITCLGLLGMISNKVVEKTKEIGIRKVLGARIHQIAQLLMSTTMRQVVIANVVGIPLAYYLVQQYLQKFSERMNLAWWHYAIPVCILMAIMLMTVATVLMKAAKSNPVEALKHE